MTPRGWVALVMGAGVSTFFICIGLAVIIRGRPISTNEATLLSTIGGAAVGAIATWLGGIGMDTLEVSARTKQEPIEESVPEVTDEGSRGGPT